MTIAKILVYKHPIPFQISGESLTKRETLKTLKTVFKSDGW